MIATLSAPPKVLSPADSAFQAVMVQIMALPERVQDLADEPRVQDILRLLFQEHPDLELSLDNTPSWELWSGLEEHSSMWAYGACNGYDGKPITILTLGYLNGYRYGLCQQAYADLPQGTVGGWAERHEHGPDYGSDVEIGWAEAA